MLSKKDIEELATGAVKRYFNTCNLVSPQIQENDKTPDWDGELNLYENKKDIRKNYGIKEQIDTITNRYNKWLYLFHISSC